ncbi:hypothetical protein E2C01_016005 [Portunus trituberculatus]|uniref:Uncharacterized protein n=1 Tax=Portunus trituberculatus TaxID=210409 RepID=A0A5B7DMY3_PORTR|nr:hypothetical protein [Portunus trituberculatus]
MSDPADMLLPGPARLLTGRTAVNTRQLRCNPPVLSCAELEAAATAQWEWLPDLFCSVMTFYAHLVPASGTADEPMITTRTARHETARSFKSTRSVQSAMNPFTSAAQELPSSPCMHFTDQGGSTTYAWTGRSVFRAAHSGATGTALPPLSPGKPCGRNANDLNCGECPAHLALLTLR